MEVKSRGKGKGSTAMPCDPRRGGAFIVQDRHYVSAGGDWDGDVCHPFVFLVAYLAWVGALAFYKSISGGGVIWLWLSPGREVGWGGVRVKLL